MSVVWVFGSINMDVVALAHRHPRVGETVMGTELHLLPGGKGANQAVAARRAGASTRLVGRLGDDAFARELRSFLVSEDLDLEYTADLPDTSTGTAVITVADADNTIVVVPGANAQLDDDAALTVPIEAGDIVLAQFETPQLVTLGAFRVARQVRATTILNPAPFLPFTGGLADLVDILVLNETELALLADVDDAATIADPDAAIAIAKRVRAEPDQTIIVTLGARGAVAVAPDAELRVPGHAVTAIDTTGAGDCFVGNLAAALARGESLAAALDVANLAASHCVQVVGAGVSMPTAIRL
jgi:ribokinase